MAETKASDVVESDDDLDGHGGGPPKTKAQKAAAEQHLVIVSREADHLKAMEPVVLAKTLHRVIAGIESFTTEALVRICSGANKAQNEGLVKLSFEAVAKTATGLLLGQSFGQTPDARQDQVRQVLMQLFAAIRSEKSQLAETFFAKFAKRRAIDQFRRRDATIEEKLERQEPTDLSDPIDELPSREPSPEDRALLSAAVAKLPPKLRTAFIQKHWFGFTNKEIAEQNGVDVRTVHNWLKTAGETLGLEGESNDR